MYHLAIDIGASSGRHILGHIEDGRIVLEEIYRFDNIQISKNGHDCWNLDMLFSEVVNGIKKSKELGKIPTTMGIDTWGVDYILVDGDGNLTCDAVSYRDSRTNGMKEKLEQCISFDKLYEKTGIQYQPFNTVYQILAHKAEHPEHFEKAKRFLMIPEYLNFKLTGKVVNEYTNATTTALVNAENKEWDKDILAAIGVDSSLFGKLNMPKTTVGTFTKEIQSAVGFDCKVILVATHDTASAFMAVPAENDTSVYISSGTWSLLGVENMVPITNKESQSANFTNEGGYDYRFRYLKNIMGLWMIQSIRRELNGISYVAGKNAVDKTDKKYGFEDLIKLAEECENFNSVVDIDSPVFLSPKSMIEAIKEECRRTQQPVPEKVGEIMQCVYKSLSKRYAETIKQLESLTGKKYTNINIVGGGCQDMYLNRMTANATGLKVIAGPIEGTALGNLVAQFIAEGKVKSLEAARSTIAKSFNIIKIK